MLAPTSVRSRTRRLRHPPSVSAKRTMLPPCAELPHPHPSARLLQGLLPGAILGQCLLFARPGRGSGFYSLLPSSSVFRPVGPVFRKPREFPYWIWTAVPPIRFVSRGRRSSC